MEIIGNKGVEKMKFGEEKIIFKMFKMLKCLKFYMENYFININIFIELIYIGDNIFSKYRLLN